MTEESTEISVAETYAVIYERTDGQYRPVASGWTEIHLYRDTADESFRIIAWSTADAEEVVMNSDVTSKCTYSFKSNEFHKYTDDAGKVWGFGFYEDPEAKVKSNAFMDAVLDAIAARQQSGDGLKTSATETNLNASGYNLQKSGVEFYQEESQEYTEEYERTEEYQEYQEEEYKQEYQEEEYEYEEENAEQYAAPPLPPIPSKFAAAQNRALPPVLPLAARPPKPAKGLTAPRTTPENISEPIQVVRERHVTVDYNSGAVVGVPEEWREKLNGHCFGLPLKLIPGVYIDGYDSEIPEVLVLMRDYLTQNGGIDAPGIFRRAPDADELKIVKEQLDTGRFEGCEDIYCVANSLKIFFRELPKSLLAPAEYEAVKKVDTPESATELIDIFPEPERSVFLYLLDFLSEIADNSDANMMNALNLAIVIAPNLFTLKEGENPMQSVLLSQKFVQFVFNAIVSRSQMYAEDYANYLATENQRFSEGYYMDPVQAEFEQ